MNEGRIAMNGETAGPGSSFHSIEVVDLTPSLTAIPVEQYPESSDLAPISTMVFHFMRVDVPTGKI